MEPISPTIKGEQLKLVKLKTDVTDVSQIVSCNYLQKTIDAPLYHHKETPKKSKPQYTSKP